MGRFFHALDGCVPMSPTFFQSTCHPHPSLVFWPIAGGGLYLVCHGGNSVEDAAKCRRMIQLAHSYARYTGAGTRAAGVSRESTLLNFNAKRVATNNMQTAILTRRDD